MKLENVKIIAQKGRPKAILKFSLSSANEAICYYSYKKMRKNIRIVNENGFCLFEMPVGDLEDFVKINERSCGKADEIVFDKDSITSFYGYTVGERIVYFTKLTTPRIRTWIGYDCPDLVRYTVNIGRAKNWAGLNLLFYFDVLYQDDAYNTSVDNLTESEYRAFKKAMEPDWYCWEKIEQAWNNQHSEQSTEATLAALKAYELEVQELIDNYQTELESFRDKLEEIPLDCGFTMIFTNNEMINKHISLLKSRGVRSSDYLDVKFPNDYFSVTNSAKTFERFKALTKNTLTKELYVRTMLD